MSAKLACIASRWIRFSARINIIPSKHYKGEGAPRLFQALFVGWEDRLRSRECGHSRCPQCSKKLRRRARNEPSRRRPPMDPGLTGATNNGLEAVTDLNRVAASPRSGAVTTS